MGVHLRRTSGFSERSATVLTNGLPRGSGPLLRDSKHLRGIGTREQSQFLTLKTGTLPVGGRGTLKKLQAC